jgi:hypothetical protein
VESAKSELELRSGVIYFKLSLIAIGAQNGVFGGEVVFV